MYLVQADIDGQQQEFQFKQRKFAEMEFRRYCGFAFSVSLWFIPKNEDKEPYILESWERE